MLLAYLFNNFFFLITFFRQYFSCFLSFSLRFSINFFFLIPILQIPLPDDLILSDSEYGADFISLWREFFILFFLLFISLFALRKYSFFQATIAKFEVISDLYLLLWEFFSIMYFYYLFEYFFLIEEDAPTLLFNAVVFDGFTGHFFIVYLVLPAFIDCLLLFFYQHNVKYFIFNRLTALELPIILAVIFVFSCLILKGFDLFFIYLILEALSLLLVIVMALDYSYDSTEAAIKYFSISAVSAGFFLFGTAWFYGMVGNTDFFTLINYSYEDEFLFGLDVSNLILPFFFIFVSFSFKLSVFPGHAWAPDVYSGSSFTVIYFISVFFKLVFIFVFIEILYLSFSFLYFWRFLLIFSSFGSALVSFFGAYKQNNLKRWLAYSTVNQMGFILLGLTCYDSFIGLRSVLFYTISYFASVSILFSIFSQAVSRNFGQLTTLNDLVFFSRQNPKEAFFLTCALFSLAGLPPFIGFFSKYFILLALFESNLQVILFFFFLLNAFSAYYYLRLVQVIWTSTLSNIFLNSSVWHAYSNEGLFCPKQQTEVRFFLFLIVPFFATHMLELCSVLSAGTCPWTA